jgi:ribosome modulation factor
MRRWVEAYEIGVMDGSSGRVSRDQCRYRNPDLKARWLAGWHAGRRQWEEQREAPLTEDQRRLGLEAIARMRAALGSL